MIFFYTIQEINGNIYCRKGPDWQMRDMRRKEIFVLPYLDIFFNYMNVFSIHDYLNKCKIITVKVSAALLWPKHK